MIFDLFLPEKLGNYYLLPKRVLGFEITKSSIYATQVYLSGKSIVIEKFFHEPIENGELSVEKRIGTAIKNIINQAATFNEINVAISSAFVVTKEITFPFLDREKISLVIDYEMEQYLPFSIQEAVIDFTIINQNAEEKRTTVLAAAAPKTLIRDYLAYFEQANVDPAIISIDLFDLYSLFKVIPAYMHDQRNIVLLDIGLTSTRLAFLQNGRLKFIRNLPNGLGALAKNLHHQFNMTQAEALDEIYRFQVAEVKNPAIEKVITTFFNEYWKTLLFTFESFLKQSGSEKSIEKIYLFGPSTSIDQINLRVRDALRIDVANLSLDSLLHESHVILKEGTHVPNRNYISLAAAYPSFLSYNFNLRKNEFKKKQFNQFIQKIMVGGTLLILTLTFLSFSSWWRTRTLYAQAVEMEQEVIKKLNSLELTDAKNLAKSIEEAEEKVSREEQIWFSFSRQTRFSFLKYLQELSSTIDRKSIGLNLKKLIITSNAITLEGQVTGFDELKVLERELKKSNLFTFVPTFQELKFSEQLPLKKNGESS